MPMASIDWPRAASLICAQIVSAIWSAGMLCSGVDRRRVLGIDAYRPDETVVVHQSHGDVFHGQHADRTSHRESRRRG